jgi:hypothetical protein
MPTSAEGPFIRTPGIAAIASSLGMTTRSPKTALVRSVKNPEITVTAIARAFSRAFPANSIRTECLRQLVTLGAAILFVALLVASHGLDLSPGFF